MVPPNAKCPIYNVPGVPGRPIVGVYNRRLKFFEKELALDSN
jgi:hypothetical protein